MRIVAVDYGTARIGLARSDPEQRIAQPWKTIEAGKNPEESARSIVATLQETGSIASIVIGLPLLLSGRESPMSSAVRSLATHLETLLAIPIILWDERLTSIQVEQALKEGGFKRKERSRCSDMLSATLILQNYLDHKRMDKVET